MPHANRFIAAAVWIALARPGMACEPDSALDDIHQAVARGLELVVKAANRYPENQSCFSCHHQTLPMLAAVAGREAGIAADAKFLAAQAEFTHASFADDIEDLRQGKGIGGRAMTVAYAFWALRLADRPNDEITAAMTTYLLKTQHDDGHWSRQTNRPPLEESNLACTTLALYGLQKYAETSQKAGVDAAIAKAKRWLAETEPASQEDRCFRLLSLHLLRGADEELAAARRLVLTAQREDGGWAQLDDMESDAYATGQTLYVLQKSGLDTASAEYRRGIRFLLDCQGSDGSWFVKSRSKPVQPYFDNGDPHGKDQFISTSASSWAVAALAAALSGTMQPKLADLPLTSEVAQDCQASAAKSLGVEQVVTNSVGMKLSLIPPGRFTIGPNGSTYRVTINKPYYIGVTEVTLGQYRRFKPGHEVAGAAPEFNADDLPAAMVNWKDAQAFCQWLSERPEEQQARRTYALPTEAQWEWAARAGTTTSRYFGDTDKGQVEYSWFNHTYTPNPQHEVNGRGRQPVGRLKPNAWGLFDMLGNVWEWCGDRRSNETTAEEWQPVMRRGSWRSGAFHCAAVAHDPGDPNTRADNIGFRVVCQVIALAAGEATAADSAPNFPGKRSEWNGYDRYDFEVDSKPVLVVTPKDAAPGKPWVWHGEFFGHKPAPDIALLGKGFHIVYMSVPDMLGCPEAVKHWNAFYKELTEKYGFAKKAALVGLSRGGLYVYNWAEANPDTVACIYADAAVCDFKSWPGGKGKGKGSPRDWQLALDRYHFKDGAEALAYDKNPIDNLEPLAKAHVPLLHVYGDADEVVPWDENTGIVAERYKKLGGEITLIAKPGVGHHPHGLEDSTPIVEFILKNAGK